MCLRFPRFRFCSCSATQTDGIKTGTLASTKTGTKCYSKELKVFRMNELKCLKALPLFNNPTYLFGNSAQSLAHPHPRVIKVVGFITGLQESRTRFTLRLFSKKYIPWKANYCTLFHQKSKHLFKIFLKFFIFFYLRRFEAIPRSQNDLTSQ